ncbi:hypothetical protein [Aeromonas veronii]|uniref:hypothetical protein n=1 Tax=Aeromonas veronii TaxID=654 RepID=UPI003D24445A
MRIDLNEDDISWVCDGEKITVLGDCIDAVYDNKLDRVTALEFSSVSFFDKKGTLLFIVDFIFNAPGASIYCLANESVYEAKIVRVVIAHEPPFKGERFWQHDINLENGSVSEPITKWR